MIPVIHALLMHNILGSSSQFSLIKIQLVSRASYHTSKKAIFMQED